MQLHDFLTAHREELLVRCKAKVASRPSPVATEAELHGVPLFLDQLVAALQLRLGGAKPDMKASAIKHGRELLQRGFTVSQVVHDYGDVCQAVTELAEELKAPIATDDFRIFNLCLDDAIAEAVTEYVHQHQRSADNEDAERLGAFAHELRNLLNSALLAYEVLKTGTIGIGGNTGAALGRNLMRMKELIVTTLTDVRLGTNLLVEEELQLLDVIEAVMTTAHLDAKAFPIRFAVEPVPIKVLVKGDRTILEAAIVNLLQNAFKFTRVRGGLVSLRARATADRVFIDVEDECGGLSKDPKELFRPFEQSHADRSGLGLGLSIAHRGITAMGGRILVVNKPGAGCVFTIELPRVEHRQT